MQRFDDDTDYKPCVQYLFVLTFVPLPSWVVLYRYRTRSKYRLLYYLHLTKLNIQPQGTTSILKGSWPISPYFVSLRSSYARSDNLRSVNCSHEYYTPNYYWFTMSTLSRSLSRTLSQPHPTISRFLRCKFNPKLLTIHFIIPSSKVLLLLRIPFCRSLYFHVPYKSLVPLWNFSVPCTYTKVVVEKIYRETKSIRKQRVPGNQYYDRVREDIGPRRMMFVYTWPCVGPWCLST